MVGMEGHRGLFDEMTSELKQRIRMRQQCEDLEADHSRQRELLQRS